MSELELIHLTEKNSPKKIFGIDLKINNLEFFIVENEVIIYHSTKD